MSIAIAPIPAKRRPSIPLNVLLQLTGALKKTLLSKKFYQEINDKVFTKASTIDSVLYFVCYFTLLASSILNNKTKIKQFLQDQRLKVAKALGVDRSNNKWVQKLAARQIYTDSKSNLAVHLKAISSYISDVRIFNRLGDCIKYMPWILDELTAFLLPSSDVPKFTRFVNLLQALNCFVLEAFENAGWLTDHNWVGTSDNNYWCIETYIWCSRVWGAYLVIEILELLRRTPVKSWDRQWKISLFKQVVQLPLVVHWSLYDGCLTPFWVGLCGTGASWWGFRDVIGSLQL